MVEVIVGCVSTSRSEETIRGSTGGIFGRGSHLRLGPGKLFFEFVVFGLELSILAGEVSNEGERIG